MDQIVVNRYRPMRVFPAVTTRAIIHPGPLLLARTLWAGAGGVNRQNTGFHVRQGVIWVIFLRERRGVTK
jgi:hypothetical protein